MIDPKKIDSLEGLIKSLSTMKNPEWNFAQWMMFINKSRDCVELVNLLREQNDMKKKIEENKKKKELEESNKAIEKKVKKVGKPK